MQKERRILRHIQDIRGPKHPLYSAGLGRSLYSRRPDQKRIPETHAIMTLMKKGAFNLVMGFELTDSGEQFDSISLEWEQFDNEHFVRCGRMGCGRTGYSVLGLEYFNGIRRDSASLPGGLEQFRSKYVVFTCHADAVNRPGIWALAVFVLVCLSSLALRLLGARDLRSRMAASG